MKISSLTFPKVKDVFNGPRYESFKRSLQALMLEQRINTFDKEASPEGPWKPIKSVDNKLKRSRKDFRENPNSKKSKEMKEGNKILQDKGILRASFTEFGAEGSNHSIEGDEVAIETNVEYAATHNFGDEKRNIEARPFDQFSDEDVEEINQLTEDFVNEENWLG